jgi:hypothetical protein
MTRTIILGFHQYPTKVENHGTFHYNHILRVIEDS